MIVVKMYKEVDRSCGYGAPSDWLQVSNPRILLAIYLIKAQGLSNSTVQTTKINDTVTNQDHQKYHHAHPRDHIPAQRLLQRQHHVEPECSRWLHLL
jgi:hypothetical protein